MRIFYQRQWKRMDGQVLTGGTFKQWTDQGVTVKKGSTCKAKILVPAAGGTFKKIPIFHVSQTDDPTWV